MAQYCISSRSANAIVVEVERAVRDGVLRPRDPLPAIREAATSAGVAPGTVASAYRLLRERGITTAHGRRGTRIAARPPVAITTGPPSMRPTFAPALGPAVDLASGNPDPALLPDLAGHLADLRPRLRYDEAPVLAALAEEAGARFQADGVPAGPVTVAHSTMDGLERTLRAHLRPSDAVAVEDPCWPRAVDLLRGMGLRPVPMAVDSQGPTADGLAGALTDEVRAVLITTRVQNPTGAAVTAERRAGLADVLATRPEVLCVEDDHTAELSGVPVASLAGVTERWVVIRSPGKAFGPDLRIATLTGDETTISRVQGGLELGAGWVSTLLQQLLLACWTDDAIGRLARRAAAVYTARRDALLDACAARGLVATGRTGLNVWVSVPDEAAALAGAQQQGFRLAAGARFRLSSAPAVRVTTAAMPPEAVEVLADALADATPDRMA